MPKVPPSHWRGDRLRRHFEHKLPYNLRCRCIVINSPAITGVGIIDFEAWRPSFDQLYGTQDIYKTESINIEKRLHDDSYYWDDDMIKDEVGYKKKHNKNEP